MNKILVKLYVPIMESEYDVWIPLNKRVYNVIGLLVRVLKEFSGNEYNPQMMPKLYDKSTGIEYNVNEIVEDTSMRNGTEIILI